ncbi:MAG: PQQ-binding-like beta-propeller repeat protein [Pirellulales bacterium]|nr:PQQ-binding-like beta-propeller repeat protein [Pirellulales bacterium]
MTKRQLLRIGGALIFGLAMLCLIAYVVSGPAKVSSGGDWPQWRYDAGRGASTPMELPEELHLQWVRQLPTPTPAWPASQPWLRFDVSYSPVAAGKLLFVPSMVNDTVTAYDTETGTPRWRFFTDGPVRFAPVVHNGKVYFGSDDGYLYCVDAARGALLWRVRGGPSDRKVLGNNRLISTWPVRGGPVLWEGKIYFTAGVWPFMGIFVHAVDAETGQVIWTNSGAGSEYTVQPHDSPAFAGLAPRGHLAATQHGLIVPGGRTQPGCYDLQTGRFRYFRFGEKNSGSHHVTARDQWYFTPDTMAQIADGKAIEGTSPTVHDETILYSVRAGKIIAMHPRAVEKTNEQTDRKGKKTQVKSLILEPWWTRPVAPAAGRLFLKAGSRLFLGRHSQVSAVEAGRGSDRADPLWQAAIEGRPWSMLAADGKLFVVTEQGRIYCFGAMKGQPVVQTETAADELHTEPPANASHAKTAADVSSLWQRHAEEILDVTGTIEGYCLMFGLGSGRLAEALVRRSQLHLVAIDPSAERVDAFRRRMRAAGLYGVRVAAHVGDPVQYPLPPYLADLLVSEDAGTLRTDRGALFINVAFRSLRPYGGVACLPTGAESLQAAVARARPANAKVKPAGQHWSLLVREGALPGAADWTHQYADAGNSVVSQDTLAKAPMGLLWFGNGPPNDAVLPRHGHGPSPQVAAGRLLIEGPDMLRAMDIYTGRLLWQQKLPQLGRFYDSTEHQPGAAEIGSNYVTLDDAVYVVYGKSILKFDSADGRLRDEFVLEAGPDDSPPNWGFLAAWEDQLIATSTPVEIPGPEEASDATSVAQDAREPIIAAGGQWQYLAGSDPPSDWTAVDYDATGWKTGEAGFGYGDDDDRTELDDMEDKYQRVYLRGRFDGAAARDAVAMALLIDYDDAFVAYLNGVEVARVNVASGSGPDVGKIKEHEAGEPETFPIKDFRKLLRPGANVLAIEGHNNKLGSSDFTLDPCLLVQCPDAPDGEDQGKPDLAWDTDQFAPVPYASASRRLVVMDRHTGRQLWHRNARYGFRHNNIAVGAGKVFCIDGMSQHKLEKLNRRGIRTQAYHPQLMALDVRTGEETWSTEEDVFGTFLAYSAEHDVLLQAGSAARDRAFDESASGMATYRGGSGEVIWKDLTLHFSGPLLLHHDTIITQGTTSPNSKATPKSFTDPITGRKRLLPVNASSNGGPALSLLTGKPKNRSHPLTGKPIPWKYTRNYGCNTAIGSEHLLTFRSAAAGFYDLTRDGGTGNFGGFKSGCTSNLIVAGGLLSAPEYTRTCTCRYQNQTSLALVHDPDVEMWTFNAFDWGGSPVRRVGINFGAPGDRMADDGTLWLDYPSRGGPSPDLPLKIEGDEVDYFRYHSSRIEADADGQELAWVAASGLKGAGTVTLTLSNNRKTPRKYHVRLHFAEVDDRQPGQRIFDVTLQGEPVLRGFDVAKAAGGVRRAVVQQFHGIEVTGTLKLSLVARDGDAPPILCGLEAVAED